MDVTAGLNLYLSNSLDILSNHFLENFKDSYKKSSFFEKKIVVVQTTGVAKWLSYKLSDSFGVCANVDFMFPKGFIVKTLKDAGFLSEDDINFYDKHSIVINILRHLNGGELRELKSYVDDKSGKRLGQFASYLADLFDQYLTYRPEFIKNGRGISQDWQKKLFLGILHKNRQTLAQTIEHFLSGKIKLLEDATLELFAISLLPPMYTYFFRKLSENVEVNLYALNPSREFWLDDAPEVYKVRMIKKTGLSEDKMHFLNSNPILINNGKLTQDFLSLLYESEYLMQPHEIETYDKYENETCLGMLKNSILKNNSDKLNCDDSTIEVHSYQTKLREIEGLYNNILNILDKNSDISLEDIVVMCPKIDEYSPFIDGFFKDKNMKYTISDNKMPDEDEGIKAVFHIMENLSERFNVNQFIEFIELEAVKRKFQLSNSDVEMIKGWFESINLRWGLKENFIKENFENMNIFNTFEYCLKRLLYGYLSGKEDIINDVLSYEELSLTHADILGKVLYIVDKAAEFSKTINKKGSIDDHRNVVEDLIATFLDDSFTQSTAFLELKNHMNKFEHCDIEVPFFTFYEILKSSINKSRKEFNFLKGGITFCELVPLRSIPFKVVCLIGMNGEGFPRNTPKVSFNEMEQHVRRGDRSARLNDRLLFLETILSAERYLYISYIGKDIKRNNTLNPSVVVSELMDFAALKAVEHPLHAFSAKYFDNSGNNGLKNYSREDFELAKKLLAKGQMLENKKIEPFEIKSEEGKNQQSIISIVELIRFLRHPVKFFFINNGVNLGLKDDTLKERENIKLNALERYILIKKAFEDGGITKRIEYSGVLPHGSFGKISQNDIQKELQALNANLKKVDSEFKFNQLKKQPVRVSFQDALIEGDIAFLYDNSSVVYVEYTSKDRNKLSFYRILEPVVYSALLDIDGHYVKNLYFVNTKECLHFKQAKINREILSFVVNLFKEARRKPIVLFEPDKFDKNIPLKQNIEGLVSRFMPKDDDRFYEYLLEKFEFSKRYEQYIYKINDEMIRFRRCFDGF